MLILGVPLLLADNSLPQLLNDLAVTDLHRPVALQQGQHVPLLELDHLSSGQPGSADTVDNIISGLRSFALLLLS